jgi:hypothetical protein
MSRRCKCRDQWLQLVERRVQWRMGYIPTAAMCGLEVGLCVVSSCTAFAQADTRRVFRTLRGDSGRGRCCTWMEPMAIGPWDCLSCRSRYGDGDSFAIATASIIRYLCCCAAAEHPACGPRFSRHDVPNVPRHPTFTMQNRADSLSRPSTSTVAQQLHECLLPTCDRTRALEAIATRWRRWAETGRLDGWTCKSWCKGMEVTSSLLPCSASDLAMLCDAFDCSPQLNLTGAAALSCLALPNTSDAFVTSHRRPLCTSSTFRTKIAC